MSGEPSKSGQLSKTARNEQIKLAAAFINNLGVAAAFAGCIVPVFALLSGGRQPPALVFALPVFGLLMGAAFHFVAHVHLRNLAD